MIETAICRAENLLSYGSRVPVLGAIPAALKMVIGAIQIAVGVAIAILSSPFALCGNEKGKAIFARALSHVIHGLANLFIAIIEAIPGLGTYFYHVRFPNANRETVEIVWKAESGHVSEKKNDFYTSEVEIIYHSPHQGRWIAYKELDATGMYSCLDKGKVIRTSYSLTEQQARKFNVPFSRTRDPYWILV